MEPTPQDAMAQDTSAPQDSEQDEFEAALAADGGGTFRDVAERDIVEGIVTAVHDSGVLVDVGCKSEGFIPLSEFSDPSEYPAPGETIEVAVVRIDEEKDQIRLSKKRADYERMWHVLMEHAKNGEPISAVVTERVKGGLRVDVGVSGFIPASQVGTRDPRNLDRFVGRELRLKVLEADRESNKVILSHRVLVEEDRERRKVDTLARLEPGIIAEGKVRSLTNYGAFVDLGGIDGLLHVSEMSWIRIKHPSEVMKVGDTVRVVVLEIADEGNRISLGMRQILPDPWKAAAAKLKVGSVVKATIVRPVRTGAFAQLKESGIEGFIPVREISSKRVNDPADVVHKGQDVDVKIMELQPGSRRMTLSMLEAESEKERVEVRSYISSQDREKRTLGDQFGGVLAAALAQAQEPESPAPKPKPSRAKVKAEEAREAEAEVAEAEAEAAEIVAEAAAEEAEAAEIAAEVAVAEAEAAEIAAEEAVAEAVVAEVVAEVAEAEAEAAEEKAEEASAAAEPKTTEGDAS
jgi:small subunit ribosomal protein S1